MSLRDLVKSTQLQHDGREKVLLKAADGYVVCRRAEMNQLDCSLRFVGHDELGRSIYEPVADAPTSYPMQKSASRSASFLDQPASIGDCLMGLYRLRGHGREL